MSLISHLPLVNLHTSPPVLSVGFAVGACTLFTVSYVGSLYLTAAGRVTDTKDENGEVLDRDHPKVIRARIKTASLATAVTVVATGAISWVKEAVVKSGWLLDTLNISRLLGLPLPTPTLLTSSTLPFNPPLSTYFLNLFTNIALPLALTASLFLGPLYTLFLDSELPFQSRFSFQRDVVEKFTSLPGIRNFIVGPLTEEFVFRSCFLSLLSFTSVSRNTLLFASPGFFGIAHIHHAYNVYLSNGRTRDAALRGAMIATVQFGYTMLFGWYANFLFLRTGTLVGPVTAHVWCNVMGLPNPKEDADRHPQRSGLIWATHALGIALFAKSLFPLTAPSLLGGSLYWP